jgi:hypothetical protein
MIAQKISHLHSYLMSLGLDTSEIEEVVDTASEEIRSNLNEIVTQAVREAKMAGDQMDADEFLSQITLDVDSGYLQIGTQSGKTDFSEAPYPMLPWLLKNAKVAKDGSLYKVIPVGASSGDQRTSTVKDIEASIQRMVGSNKMSDMASEMAANFGMGGTIVKTKERTAKPVEAFRVASSKQDPNASWVKPAKDKDMTSTLMDINSRLRSDIDNMVDRVIDKYSRGMR